jgi:GT2 family glycosyltransferase
MDDVPAGPASPEPRRPPLSVVVPVHDGGSDFEYCLRRLRDSSWTDYELIVVDDGSTDGSGALAQSMGATVARNERALGPAAARNLGAQLASASLLFFLDADVAVHPDTLGRGMARFMAEPTLTALFGSYDDQPSAPGIVSQFRNLLHHFVHQQGSFNGDTRPVHTFWTGCGMIRRQVFLDFGGFDPRLYPRPAIEDIELGYRLTRTGLKIVLARDVLATHLKRWTMSEMIRTDIFRRGVPWMLLIKRSGTLETDLNVKPGQKVCVVLTGLAFLGLLASPWDARTAAASAMSSVAIIGLNRDFYSFLRRRRGAGFALASLPLHLIYYTCCGVSVVLALVQWHALKWSSIMKSASPHMRVDRGGKLVPRPVLSRVARRLSRWTRRPR